MSIYSSMMCPECREDELTIANAFAWNKIRLSCVDGCGYMEEIELTDEESDMLRVIFGKRKGGLP